MPQPWRVGAIILTLALLPGKAVGQQPGALRVPAAIGHFRPATPAHAEAVAAPGLLGPGDRDYRYSGPRLPSAR